MAPMIRIYCDRCKGEAPIVTYGDFTQARLELERDRWSYHFDSEHGPIDLCPVCNAADPSYWDREPF
jgi:hypothetical protein